VAQPHLRGAEQPVWLGLLALEHDNLRAAHDWLFQTGADESCLRLAGALGDFWDLRGHWSEGLARIEPVLARSTTAVQTPTRARALQVMGTLYGDLGNIDLATRALEQSVGLWREVGDEKGLAGALADWGYWLLFARPYVEDVVLPKLHESLQRYRNVGDTPGAAFVLLVLADQASMRSDAAHARALLEESNDLFEQTGDAWGIAWSLSRLAELTAQQGDLAAATRMCERSLQIFRELDVKEGEGNVLGCLALLACKEGDLTTATALCERLTTLQRELGNSMMLAVSLINLGHLSRLQGDSKAALASYREARSLIDQGNGFGPYYRYLIRGLLAQVQSQHDKALAAFEECLGAAEEQLQDRARAKHRAVCLVATTTSLLAQGQVAEAATILASLSSTPPDVSMSRLTYSLDYARNLATTHALLGANSPSRVSRP
jgi:tetratricopeptide (TPR) repeat protein